MFTGAGWPTWMCTHTRTHTLSRMHRTGEEKSSMLPIPRGAKQEASRRKGVGVHTYLPSYPQPPISDHISFPLGLAEKRRNQEHWGYFASVTSFRVYQPIKKTHAHTHRDYTHTHAYIHTEAPAATCTAVILLGTLKW